MEKECVMSTAETLGVFLCLQTVGILLTEFIIQFVKVH